jgi:hypothetical protein
MNWASQSSLEFGVVHHVYSFLSSSLLVAQPDATLPEVSVENVVLRGLGMQMTSLVYDL